MARSTQRYEAPQTFTESPDPAIEPQEPTVKSSMPASPTRSDGSSESEGRPVREKLKETRIDAQNSSDLPSSSDLPMSDAPNGTYHASTQAGDQSTSGSESDRGRLRRKRSFEDFTVDHGAEKQPEKHERHARKKSRDVTSPPAETPEVVERSANELVAPINENEGDETMISIDRPAVDHDSTSNRPVTPEGRKPDMDEAAIVSPKNKRTRDALDRDVGSGLAADSLKESESSVKAEEERNPKRQRDKSEPQPLAEVKEDTPNIPATGSCSKVSAPSPSPFAALSPTKPASSGSRKTVDDAPQTSDENFKKSGFGNFAGASSSPFGALGGSGSNSPFAPAGAKLTSFASPSSSSGVSEGGFGALANSSSKSVFGGSLATPATGNKSVFGGTLGNGTGIGFSSQSAFANLRGSKTLASFATPGVKGITGLKAKHERVFGASPQDEEEDDEDGENDEDSASDKEASEQDPRFHQQEVETGEEGENTAWSGRAKLYSMVVQGTSKQWQERGVGPFKLNVSKDAPKKARFVLRADGTHRLLLNAAVTKTLKFGTPEGLKPADGKVYFNIPTVDGGIEMHTLKMKNEKAVELYDAVKHVQQHEL
ncbi:uncharacterized protein BDR25DRAFT_88031 [Lindgomyces ingoldianus]|uniref:Uncharacterized protein n=1 Tax=Lindgomyces ingoldianus TaxID=673940 RepID=A0ACB6R955_9PLEO|nr:uncharacterized protein BDR25DRAFT_88031 [Lindgomyces ingoldianus]KAF2475711.1 hypothetical protein BDR25DRAFT_88031 [Lindgomyces ingoldianus]